MAVVGIGGVIRAPSLQHLRTAKRNAHILASYVRVALGFRIRAMRGRSLTDQICAKMLKDRRRELVTFADKVAVREFVERRIGAEFLTRLYWSGQDPANIPWADLPKSFALKVTHASGGIILVSDSAPENAMLPPITSSAKFERYLLRPSNFDEGVAGELLRGWLSQIYRGHPAVKEWAYTEIPPRILVEEFLESDSGEIPDYKFFMINGKCELIQLDQSRFSGHRRNLYTPEWNLHQVSLAYPMLDEPVEKPATLEAMISLAESLAHGVDFIRVDLYCVGN